MYKRKSCDINIHVDINIDTILDKIETYYKRNFASFIFFFFPDCHWEKSINNGTITSPNYPENYPSFANCSMCIQASDPATRILIVLENVHLEMDANCSYDFLQISEGPPRSK